MAVRLLDARWPVSLAFVGFLLTLWQGFAAADELPDYILSPAAIVSAWFEELTGHELLSDTLATLKRQLPGFLIGASLGVLAGLLAGVVRAAEDVLDSIVSATYPLPKISLFPVFVVWLGFSDSARVLVIALSCFYPAFINSLTGTRGIDRRWLWVARNVGASRVRRFFQVVLPAALPSALVGLRISLALSFVLAFATEAIGASRDGLGHLIQESYANQLYDPMYAGILSFALLGLAADVVLRALAARFTRGQRLEAVGIG